ncbi:PadR family transcriptional regulator [Nocardiopsis suaedae]|uniref:PadR family transcriptional regulator n=1 Tax=Nocardiopsis suaedae TaxID=3018444 RepID=A0ABT4THI5_9ACTN|nr:PadR family transcriptional regulator [Nocardiopsis suaedae]MDA2804120.1 PadR family transcriptional regulator [Nocardiopsis suaedae]
MAHVILGLLLIAPQSYYDLIKAFEAGVGLFYSASSGSIKRALDRLLAQGLVEVADAESGGRGRKAYRPTGAGREEFGSWMAAPPTGSDAESGALARLYFLGLLEEAERLPVLRGIEERLEGDLAALQDLDRGLDTRDVPEGLHEVFAYQRATLDYGLAANRFALGRFRALIDRHERGEPPRD